MDKILNCAGMACPRPVVETRNYIEKHQPDAFTVIVDNPAACENVTRFLKAQDYIVTENKQPPLWRLEALRDKNAPPKPMPSPAEVAASVPCPVPTAKILVLIPSNFFGSGDDELGTRLMKNFLLTLPEMSPELWRVILLNGGVKLAVTGSPVLEELRALQDQGVSLLVCGSCLEYFGLLDQKQVGQTTNMLDVVTSMQLADKVVRV